MRIKNNIHHVIVLMAGMLLAGLAAVAIGKELNWDLASYHFYNPFALLHQRTNFDVWPIEFVHAHLSPTADFITYYFVTTLPPKTAVFLLGAIHGINLWLLYAIALSVLVAMPRVIYQRTLALVLAVLGMYGPTVVPGLGSFQHDALVSLFVLGFVLIFLQVWQNNFPRKLLISAGLMLGIAAGLKLTTGIFVLSALLSIVLVNIGLRQQVRMMLLLSAGIVMGVMLTSGYWFILQWQEYHNPIYPLMNGIFHSPYFPSYNWKDSRFLPEGWLQKIFFPFYFSFDGRTNDVPFRDFRFAVLYVLLIVVLLKKMIFPSPNRSSTPVKWLLGFFVSAYIIWQCGFAIMRYAMPLEMLAPLVIYCLLDVMCQQTAVKNGWLFSFIVLTVMGMYPAQAVRAPWYAGDYFNVALPANFAKPAQALVLMPLSAYAFNLKPRPQTYLIAYLPLTWRYVGVPFKNDQLILSDRMYAEVSQFNGRIYILASSEYVAITAAAMQRLNLVAEGECANITSDRQKISNEDVKLCPFRKLSFPIHRA